MSSPDNHSTAGDLTGRCSGPAAGEIDLPWFERHLLDDILPHWLAAAVDDDGFFHPRLTRQWQRTGEPVATLVSQGRLCHNFAIGYELTGHDGYREALQRGAHYLAECFRDPGSPGWVFAVHRDGHIVDGRKDTYGHAFLLFGLAHAARLLHEDRLVTAIEGAADFVTGWLRDRRRAYAMGMNRQVTKVLEPGRRLANPMMHLFEAFLAASALWATGPPLKHVIWLALAAGVALFVQEHLIRADTGGLPEEYTSDWVPPAEGAWVNIGHQFEWAYLLSRWSEVRPAPAPDFSAMAEGLLDYGLAEGFDPTDGGICTRVALNGPTPPEWRKERGWWEQAEASRAMMHFAFVRGRHDLLEPLKRNIEFIKTHLVDHEYGGWFPRPGAVDALKGNEWKVDYHVVGLCAEAVRLARMAEQRGGPL